MFFDSTKDKCYDKNMSNIQPDGVYRHYKGKEYEIIGEGTHTETEERLIVYKALYAPYAIWVRPYDMFFETIVVDGIEKPRFAYIGQ